MMERVILKPGREKSVQNRHPWVYSGAIQRVEGEPQDGAVVAVHSADGEALGWGYINRQSKITVRLLSWDMEEQLDDDFWRGRLTRAMVGRGSLLADGGTDAYRLVHAESDGLPGLIVDRYGDWLVLQLLTLGMEVRREQIVRYLTDLMPEAAGVYERSDVDVREKEGLPPAVGLLHGAPPPAELLVRENYLRFAVDLAGGHKTGFYLDQRDNRAQLVRYAAGLQVLNCFAYTGAFSVYAAQGGAGEIVNVETSAEALAWAQRNMRLNGFAEQRTEYLDADVFQQLRRYRDQGRQFDLIVLDPPKFAHSQSGVKRAARGYKDINWLAMRLLRPGGLLFTFSCSGAISAELFQKILFGAALDSGREVQLVGQLSQGADHPVLLTFPESAYLKGVICRVW